MHEAGILPHTSHLTNVISCRPPNNKIDSDEGKDALERCRPGFLAEMEQMVERGVRVFVPLGTTALNALGIEGGITKARGSVYELEIGGQDCVAIPSYHPAFILRGQSQHEVTVINDLAKADRIARRGWKRLEEHFEVYPTIDDLRRFVEQHQEAGTLLGLDIETTSLDPNRGDIICVGLATNSEHAMVVPFYSQGMEPYWSPAEFREVKQLLRGLLATNPVVIQNALFDAGYLEAHGIPVGNLRHDILLMHHAIHPEVAHNLGYIVSIYGQTPYWKDVILGSPDKLSEIPDEELRTYNARDCVTLLQVLEPMLEDLKETEVEGTYEISMKLIPVIMEMHRNGLPIDEKSLSGWRAKTKKLLEKAEQQIREEMKLPPAFNLDSPDDLRYLIHKIPPAKYRKARKTMDEEYGEGSTKSLDTKKYAALVEALAVVDQTEPLYQTSSKRKTSTGRLPDCSNKWEGGHRGDAPSPPPPRRGACGD